MELFFTKEQFDRVKALPLPEEKRLAVIADMIRHNTLGEVMSVGSGHLGTSLSAADAWAVLYHAILKIDPATPEKADRDIFILSKGHAAPGMYVTLASRGFIEEKELLTFRRLGGLQGHVDIMTPGIDANTGSVGMGISKAKGHAVALKMKGSLAHVFVMAGDGELQEGQHWEALQSASSWELGNLVLLLDQNMVQTDQLVEDIISMPPVEEKLKAFGWQVTVIDGNNTAEILRTLSSLDYTDEKPKAIVMKTVKGKGVSFMEHSQALKKDGMYLWHNKVPDQEGFEIAVKEVDARIAVALTGHDVGSDFFPTTPKEFARAAVDWKDDYVVTGYADALSRAIEVNKNIIVCDGDLAIDCGTREIEKKYPANFLQFGIAEQDMVTAAGAMARQGFLPVVNTFAAFLSSRSNEQIFNNATEYSKVLYVGHLAGLIPATPGKSHQAVRDIALLGTVSGIVMYEPASAKEAGIAITWMVEHAKGPAYLRLANCKGLADIPVPDKYQLELGKGFVVREGTDAAIIAYGPIMLSQSIAAAGLLEGKGVSVRVINAPWLHKTDARWLTGALEGVSHVLHIDDHMLVGGQGEGVALLFAQEKSLHGKKLLRLGVEGFAESGQVFETLKKFGLDGDSIADVFRKFMGKR